MGESPKPGLLSLLTAPLPRELPARGRDAGVNFFPDLRRLPLLCPTPTYIQQAARFSTYRPRRWSSKSVISQESGVLCLLYKWQTRFLG